MLILSKVVVESPGRFSVNSAEIVGAEAIRAFAAGPDVGSVAEMVILDTEAFTVTALSPAEVLAAIH